MTTKPDPPGSISSLLDNVQWNYSPDEELTSLLVPMERYFKSFPWDGDQLLLRDPGPTEDDR
jgi:hypothetical protein